MNCACILQETTFGETGGVAGVPEAKLTRSFDVVVNGQTVIHRLDVIAEAGASAANIKVLKDVSPADDGMLHLSFLPVSYLPFLNAIEITLRAYPGGCGPSAWWRLTHGYIDTDAQLLGTGPRLWDRRPTRQTPQPSDGRAPRSRSVRLGGRWGNLDCTRFRSLPAATRLRLHFAEAMFEKPSEGRYNRHSVQWRGPGAEVQHSQANG